MLELVGPTGGGVTGPDGETVGGRVPAMEGEAPVMEGESPGTEGVAPEMA